MRGSAIGVRVRGCWCSSVLCFTGDHTSYSSKSIAPQLCSRISQNQRVTYSSQLFVLHIYRCSLKGRFSPGGASLFFLFLCCLFWVWLWLCRRPTIFNNTCHGAAALSFSSFTTRLMMREFKEGVGEQITKDFGLQLFVSLAPIAGG